MDGGVASVIQSHCIDQRRDGCGRSHGEAADIHCQHRLLEPANQLHRLQKDWSMPGIQTMALKFILKEIGEASAIKSLVNRSTLVSLSGRVE